MGTEACALGILTLLENDNCMTVLTNRILCSVELVVGALIFARLVFEMRRLSAALRVMLGWYAGLLLSIVILCSIGLAEADPSTDVKYVVWSFGHCFYALGIATRTNVFMKVIYASSNNKIQFSTATFARVIFSFAALVCIIMLILWALAPLYVVTGSLRHEYIHRTGFVVYGGYLLLLGIGLAFVSRSVISMYAGLKIMSDASNQRKHQQGTTMLKHMTVAACGAMGIAGSFYLVVGAIPGALRNEMAHSIIWLVFVAMLPLMRFVRQCAEVREQHIKIEKETSRAEGHHRDASLSRLGPRSLSSLQLSPATVPVPLTPRSDSAVSIK